MRKVDRKAYGTSLSQIDSSPLALLRLTVHVRSTADVAMVSATGYFGAWKRPSSVQPLTETICYSLHAL